MVSGAGKSAMARASGETAEIPPGEFRQDGPGVAYSMRGRQMSYRRQAAAGARHLPYYIGAGTIARSYLMQSGPFLFQAPVTYYDIPKRWDMSPGFEDYSVIALNRPVEPECLACHAGRLQHDPATQNGYSGKPFLQSGIRCERCHGPGIEHVRLKGKGEIVNPVKLDARRRDSVCAECHLGGIVRIFRPGRFPGDFLPGQLLSDSIAVFAPSSGHMEQLWESACKKAAGDRLWCGSCHDPHGQSVDYRLKCLTCHKLKECGRGLECITCHMPKAPAAMIPHSAYTDHTIPRKPRLVSKSELTAATMRPFWTEAAGPRETGLALAKVAVQYGKPALFEPAFTHLQPVEDKLDAEGLLYLAVLYDQRGDQSQAEKLYRRALALRPALAEAAVNLGGILAARGEVEAAIELWKDALRRNPGIEAASIKLASAQLLQGDREAALETLRKARQFIPDLR